MTAVVAWAAWLMLATGPFSALFNLPETVLNTSCRCVVPVPILDSLLTAFFPVVATAPGACASLSSPSMYSSDRSGKGPSTSNMAVSRASPSIWAMMVWNGCWV